MSAAAEAQPMALVIHIDGGSRGNPGPAGAGIVISKGTGERVFEAGRFLGHQTNNAAEYLALIAALKRVVSVGEQTIEICSDSELMVRQITGAYRVKNPGLLPLFSEVQSMLLKISCWRMRHIRREENRRADELANLAMDRGEDVVVFDADGAASAAPPERNPNAETEAVHPVSGSTASVRIMIARAPRDGGCPAGSPLAAESVQIGAIIPGGVCIHAMHAALPTVLAILNTAPGEFYSVPTLTVRCLRGACGAELHVAPANSGNGASAGRGASC